jgi:hypothetical protein
MTRWDKRVPPPGQAPRAGILSGMRAWPAATRGQNQNFVPPLKRKICVRSQTEEPSEALAQYLVSG